jgi:acyl-coenzyme A thioesterase PaaI-like protein
MNTLKTWKTFAKFPGGKRLFSWWIGRAVPYSGSIGAFVEDHAAGYVRITLRDRRAVRNHLNCVHAIALANLGELTSGLAVVSSLQPNQRGIVTKFSVEYLKKARGLLTCTSDVRSLDLSSFQGEKATTVDITNAAGEVVARATAVWLISAKA